MLEVDRRRGAVIFAACVNRPRIAEAAFIFGERAGIEDRNACGAPACEFSVQVVDRVSSDQALRQIERLDEEEPVVVRRRERHVGCRIHDAGWRDVEHHELLHATRIIECHAMRDTTAAVVPDHCELLEAKRPHHLDLIARHRSLGIERVIVATCGFR